MSKKSPVKDRILSYLEYRGLSENEFYRESKVSRRVLKQETGISEDNLLKFLAYDQKTSHGQRVSLDWLLRGEGPMLEEYHEHQNILALEPGPDYDNSARTESIEAILTYLANMNDSYANGLKDVVKTVKKLKK